MSEFGSAPVACYLAVNKVFSVGQIFNSIIKFECNKFVLEK